MPTRKYVYKYNKPKKRKEKLILNLFSNLLCY